MDLENIFNKTICKDLNETICKDHSGRSLRARGRSPPILCHAGPPENNIL